MNKKNKKYLNLGYLFGGIGFASTILTQKMGLGRNKSSGPITWEELFTERLDVVLLATGGFIVAGYLIGLLNDNSSSNLMCRKCLTPHNGAGLEKMNCPKCGFRLEKLEGFYKRHPSLRDHKNDS